MLKRLICLSAVGLLLAMAGGAGAQELVPGQVMIEYWYGGGIGADLDTLKAHPDFPDAPHDGAVLTALDQPDRSGLDYFGARARAFLTAPADGDYTFWLASDDDSELWLSTDEDPANAVMVANLEGWCGYQDYTGTSGSRGDNYISAPVSLVAGQKYYVEFLFSDGTGGGQCSVAWSGAEIGDDPVTIAGDYLEMDSAWTGPIYWAKNPDPADGATDITSPLLTWEGAPDVIMHDLYLGTTPELGEADLIGRQPMALYFHAPGFEAGQTYYWRADGVDAAGVAHEGIVWSFTAMPLEAHAPMPADDAADLGLLPTLSWTGGLGAVTHMVYLSTDEAAVAAGDATANVAVQAETTYTPAAPLDYFATYYWRVDEINATGAVIAGPVWSFDTVTYVPLIDGQVTLDYDNTAEPFVSTMEVAVPMDLTAGGEVGDISIRFQGTAKATHGVTYDEATGTYEVTGAGNDIWSTADAFTYAHKTLTGDASMVARVTSSGSGSNQWAKGGVMIRQSLAPGSQHAFMPITAGGGNGASFQRRVEADGESSNSDSGDVVAPPYWVKLDRVGNTFSGSISADGETWTQLGDPIEVVMEDPVLIGLTVTSHEAAQLRTFSFDNVSATGDVPEGPFTAFDVVNPDQAAANFNAPASLFISLEDAAGNVAAVAHPDPEATVITSMSLFWTPLAAFEGVDPTQVVKMEIGVGNGEPGGQGSVTLANGRVLEAATAPAEGAGDVTLPGDPVIGDPNDGDWPGAETPDLAIDDNTRTKFLHFKGNRQPTGIIVSTPIYSVVTGLTFTTANDAPERDPVAFELYGSNLGTDGPWTLIAEGAIDDFARPIAWPRFTKNVTPIGFANAMPFANYKVLVTEVRNAGSANSMQIGEIELLGVVVEEPIILAVVRAGGVSGNRDPIGQYGPETAPLATEPGGLQDGSTVFSDRTYPWAGIPAEYAGAEYIRTFNSDKNGGTVDVTYTVTTSREAIVWITVDDRIPAEWDADGTIASPQDAADRVTAAIGDPGTFTDTEIDIFVREKSDGSRDRPMSVYMAQLPAGTYVFGSMDSGKNFYTIGAVDAQ